MVFRKKKPGRLYYPSKSKWYAKPRRRPSVKRTSPLLKGGLKKATKNLIKKSLFAVLVGIGFVVMILGLTFSSYLAVISIEVVRENFNINSAVIENELNQYIGKNILFFPKSRIYQTIHTKFPEFASIKVHKKFPSVITIELESHPIVANLRAYYILPEAEEVMEEEFTALSQAIEELSGIDSALVSGDEVNPLTDEEVLDAIFGIEEEEGPEATEQRSLLNRIGQAIFDQEENLELMAITIRGLSQPVEDRDQIIPEDHMDFITETIQYFQNTMRQDVLSLDYLPKAREIHLKTKDNLVVWISTERNYREQIDKFNIIYKPAELNEEDIVYIDLRVRNKVIYCPRDAKCDQ